MGERPFARLWLQDFDLGTSGLDPFEGWAYTKLLVWMYREGGPIRRVDKPLAGKCGMSVKQFKKALDYLIELGKIEVENGDMLINKRVRIELECVEAISQSSKLRSAKGHEARWGKRREINGAAVPNGNAQASVSHASAMPEASLKDADTQIDRKKDREPAALDDLHRDLVDAIGGQPEAMTHTSQLKGVARLLALIQAGYRREDIIAKARQKADWLRHDAKSWGALAGFVEADFKPQASQPAQYDPTHKQWGAVMRVARREERWDGSYGPPPFAQGCRVPTDLIEEQDNRPWTVI